MARSRGRSGPAKRERRDRTGLIVAVSALVVAGLAFYVLTLGGGDKAPEPSNVERDPVPKRSRPALDDIDAESREKMRDLLREAGD